MAINNTENKIDNTSIAYADSKTDTYNETNTTVTVVNAVVTQTENDTSVQIINVKKSKTSAKKKKKKKKSSKKKKKKKKKRKKRKKKKKKKRKKRKKKKKKKPKYSASYFRRMGVLHWGGWRWTWYSQRVLSGGGLKIPDRHVDSNGYVCDENNYICVASSTLKYGTVIKSPLGKKCKVYDSGCASDTIDVYVDW